MEDKRWDALKNHLNQLKERLEKEIEQHKDLLTHYAKSRMSLDCEAIIKGIDRRMTNLNTVHYVLGKITEINSKYGVITNE